MEKIPDSLHRYIKRLESWAGDSPPSPRELRALNHDFHITKDDREKIKKLAENHVRRAKIASEGGALDQAIAELSRSAQLQPLNAEPRITLAQLLLQRSLMRHYGRQDRQRAVRFAEKALNLHPGHPKAVEFLKEYWRMNKDFRSTKTRRYLIFLFPVFLLLAGLLWWQREWLITLLNPPRVAVIDLPVIRPSVAPLNRKVPINLAPLADSGLDITIIASSVGRLNQNSYLSIQGYLKPQKESLGAFRLLIRGRDKDNLALFSIPWVIRTKQDPPLFPGDSTALSLLRWLAETETSIEEIELDHLEADFNLFIAKEPVGKTELIWITGRPDGVALVPELRHRSLIEAYDRQVLILNLSLENIGMQKLSRLKTAIHLDRQWEDYSWTAVDPNFPPLTLGERRVWSLAISYPLDASLEDYPVTIRVLEAGL